MRLVVGIKTLTIGLLEVLVGLLRRQSVEGKLDAPCIVGSGTVDALDGRITGEDIGPSVLLLLVDTHHLEGEITQLHEAADEPTDILSAATEEFLRLLVTHHKHLTALLHVDIVDVAPVEHLHLVDLRMVGIHTTDGSGEILLAKTDGT